MKVPSKSNTKAQIIEAFEEAAAEYDKLMAQKEQLEKQLQEQKQQAKAQAAAQKQALANKSAEKDEKQASNNKDPKGANVASGSDAMNDTVSKILNSEGRDNKMALTLSLLEHLQNNFSGALTGLSEKLIIEADKLQEILKLSTEEREQLNSLYDIEPKDETLVELLEEYNEVIEGFKQQHDDKKEELGNIFSELQNNWIAEIEKHKQLISERNHQVLMEDGREREEYHYSTNLRRALDEEEYQNKLEQQEKEREEEREKLEIEWQEYEEELAKKEKEQREVLEKADKLKAEKEAAIKKAENEGAGIGNKQARIKADLLDKEIEGQRRIYEQRLQSLQSKVEAQQAHIQALSAQVDAANQQMQSLAVKAIEGAANSNSLAAFKELAMEQAKSQGKGKS